jgi:hypothetical protein
VIILKVSFLDSNTSRIIFINEVSQIRIVVSEAMTVPGEQGHNGKKGEGGERKNRD